jgi:hypothetical protein
VQRELLPKSHVAQIYTGARECAPIKASDLLVARTLDTASYLSKTFKPYRSIVSDSVAHGDVALIFRSLRQGNSAASVVSDELGAVSVDSQSHSTATLMKRP